MSEQQDYKLNSVVLIDDNEVDNMINQKLMRSSKFAKNIYVYTSGKAALEFFQNIDQNPGFPKELIPQLVLLDINMPLMNGFLFIESFKKLSDRMQDNIRIVLLTSSVNPQDMQKAKEMDIILEYISKPLSKDKLESFDLKGIVQ